MKRYFLKVLLETELIKFYGLLKFQKKETVELLEELRGK